jgi:DNA-binding protein H-NS
MSTYDEIQAQIHRLQQEAMNLLEKEKSEVIKSLKAEIAKHHLTAKDLGLDSTKRGRKPGIKRANGIPNEAKYRGPNGETWTGFGRQPQWLHDALAKGKKKEDFAI